MTVTCMDPQTMIDFHHISVTAAISGKNHWPGAVARTGAPQGPAKSMPGWKA